MKRLKIILFLPLLLNFCIYGQGTLNLTVKVLDSKGSLIQNAHVQLVESKTKSKVELRTNAQGIAKCELNYGNKWNVFINNLDMQKVVMVPERGTSIQNITETYNKKLAERFAKQNLNRTGFTNKSFSISKDAPPPKGHTLVQVLVKSRKGKPHPNMNVRLINQSKKLSYSAITDASGCARFIVPFMNNYDIDVENSLNAGFKDIGNVENQISRSTILYETYYAKEKISGDTIFQDLGGRKDPCSSHAFFTVKVLKNNQKVVNDMVYLQEINGNQVFANLTNHLGEVDFLLPLGKKYLIHMDYEKDIDAINLSKFMGFANGEVQINYRPRPELEYPEKFIPKPEELFLVDFKNFLKKQYPKPTQPKTLNLFLKWAGKVNAQSKEAVLEIGYTAGKPNHVLPQNICFVIDISGSMSGYYRIQRLKEAFSNMIDNINPETYISIIAYQSEMKVILPPTKLGNKQEKVQQLIKSLEASGGTNMLQAMTEGYKFVDKNFLINGSNRIIILTDGYDENEVKDLMDVQSPYNEKIECTTIGVGENYNYPLLKQLASNGKGLLHFIGDSQNFDTVFSKNLGAILSPTAINATLEIEYNEKIIYKHLYGLKEKSKSGNKVQFFLPNIYAGANEVALVKFDLIKPDENIEKQAVIVRLKYYEKGLKKEKNIEEKAYLKWDKYTGEIELITEAENKELYCMAIMNQALKVMSEAYMEGDNNKASKILSSTRKQVKKLYPKSKNKDIKLLLEKLEKYLTVFKNLEQKRLNDLKKKR